jgi:hypothetical protein
MEPDVINRPARASLTFSDEPGVQRIVTACLGVRTRCRRLPDHSIISMESPGSSAGLSSSSDEHQSIHAWRLARGIGSHERTATQGGSSSRGHQGVEAWAGHSFPARPSCLGPLGLRASTFHDHVSRWVMRITSSMVVRPLRALIIPSSKSVCIPCLRANLRTFCVDSPLNVISRTCADMVIIS